MRRPTLADIPAAQRMLDDIETADCGEPRRHDNRLEVDFRDPRLDLAPRHLGGGPRPRDRGAPLAALGWSGRPRKGRDLLRPVRPSQAPRPRARRGPARPRSGACRGAGRRLAPGVTGDAGRLGESRTSGGRRALEGAALPRAAVLRDGDRPRRHLENPLSRRHRAADAGRRPRRAPASRRRHRGLPGHHLFEALTYPEWRLNHIDRPDFDPALWPSAGTGQDRRLRRRLDLGRRRHRGRPRRAPAVARPGPRPRAAARGVPGAGRTRRDRRAPLRRRQTETGAVAGCTSGPACASAGASTCTGRSSGHSPGRGRSPRPAAPRRTALARRPSAAAAKCRRDSARSVPGAPPGWSR